MRISISQLRRIIREELDSSANSDAIELSDPKWANPSRHDLDALRSAWPHAINYQGRNVFELVYGSDSNVVDRAMQFIGGNRNDSQEVYLGISGLATNDPMFILGFDVWTDEGMDGTFVALHPRNLLPLDVVATTPGGVYGGGKLRLKEIMPDVLDLRLD